MYTAMLMCGERMKDSKFYAQWNKRENESAFLLKTLAN